MIQEITKILYEDILSQMTNNDSTIITLKCKEHGEFNISIKEILESENGILCPKCLSDKNILKRLNNFRNFLLKARKIHGDKYNYDKVCYKKGHEKVEIICPIHGSFLQTPSSHLSGRGCKKCAGLDKLTTEEFIERAIKVHGDRYDYSKTKYVNHRTKVIITCKEHGDFTQLPYSHLEGCGCKLCSNNVKLSTEEFIERAIKVHGDRYDYSKVKYVNNHTPVLIICKEHGAFEQVPSVHLNGCGCKKCVGLNKLTTEEFIEKSIKVHGDRYDYSKVKYINNRTKVVIICKEHGEFSQTPYAHYLYGQGCPICANNNIISTEEFIERAIKVHGDRYDYSKVKYINNNTSVLIICKEHGEFLQLPFVHLHGSGCPKCALNKKTSKLQKDVCKYLINNNFIFEDEKRFIWLKHKGYLKLDFYLPEYNVAIEVQGEQHFRGDTQFDRLKKENQFKQRYERDLKKLKLCNEHSIKIYYISDKKYVDNYELGKLYTNIDELFNDIINDSK